MRVPDRPRPRRVYTSLRARLPLLLALALASCVQAPATLSIDPTMAKGPARAPVTTVEFSDYQ